MRRQRTLREQQLGTDNGVNGIENPRIILFADNGPETAQLERLIVDTWEIPVAIITDFNSGVVAFHQMHPDLLIVDHKDAARLLLELRQDRAPESFLPTLVLVDESDRSERQADMLAGAADFLTKPIDPVEALLRIHNLLSLREARIQLQDRSETVERSLSRRIESLRQQIGRLRQHEHNLTEQSRLRALGTMASGVAHDFNNILSVVIGFTEQLLREDPQAGHEKRREALKTILTAAEDGAEIVHRLREFHRPSDSREVRTPVDLNTIVEQSVKLTRPRWARSGSAPDMSITIRTVLNPVPPVSGNAAELREMLTNLIFNAVDAMPSGGIIGLCTRVENSAVVLEVKDTGTGMPQAVRCRCLEPFFTTKGEHGTGMGLAMVHGIVERHGATIELESEPGEGTLFRFRFPVAQAVESASTSLSRAGANPLKILVVDDEPIIGEVIAEILKRDGHQVTLVTDPHEALESARTKPVDLVITDKSMPTMDGNDLAAEVKAASPSTCVLLVTGHGPEVAGSAIDHVVGKPLTVDSLRQAIDELFERV